MIVLALETSCDETSAAVIQDGLILSNVVSSQIKLHAEYGGVVPELATREHLKNVQVVAQEALQQAGIDSGQLGLAAVTQGPGLPSALMIGLKAAQGFAFRLGIPLIGIHHHEAHLYSSWIKGDPARADFRDFEPSVALIVSGGHTILVHVSALLQHRVIGGTVDDAAGECFDKVGKLLGLPYPGGPEVDRLARAGDAKKYSFPRPMLHDPSFDFSFAGLKTSVRYFLQKNPLILESREGVCDVCAGAQTAIVDVLVAKTMRAARFLNVGCVAVSGGVACNSLLRERLEEACRLDGIRLRLCEWGFSTDNAAMIGVLAEQKFIRGHPPLAMDAEIDTSWAL